MSGIGKNDLYIENGLLERISTGDEQAFTDLLKLIVPSLQAVVFKIVKQEDAALEILQETFVRIWLSRAKLPALEKPLPWFKRVALNETFTWLQKNASRAKIFAGLQENSGSDQNTGLDNLSLRETQEVLQQAIAQLPPQQKLIYQLSREEGLKSQEIADRLNLSNGYVKNTLTAALKFLKERLKEAGKMMLLSFL